MRLPLTRILQEKRRVIIPLASVLALNLAVYALVVYPLSVRVRSIEQRETAAMQQLKAAQDEDAAARAVLEGRDRADVALKEFYKTVLPSSLSSARDITYLRLNQLAQRHRIRTKSKHSVSDREKRGTLSRLRVTLDLEGNYDDVRQFIYEIESGSDFLVIDSVQLSQDAVSGAPLALTLALSTYYRSEANAA